MTDCQQGTGALKAIFKGKAEELADAGKRPFGVFSRVPEPLLCAYLTWPLGTQGVWGDSQSCVYELVRDITNRRREVAVHPS